MLIAGKIHLQGAGKAHEVLENRKSMDKIVLAYAQQSR